MAAIGLLALGLRLAYGLLLVQDDPLLGDGLAFHQIANLLADGHGYSSPGPFLATGEEVPTADKPPLYPLLLTPFSIISGGTWQAHQVAGALIGTATVVAVGLLGRRLGGDRVGLVAAGLAALYPVLVATDGSLRSESPFALATALVLIAAYRFLDRTNARRAAVLGAAIGLAALARSEAVALLVLMVLPLAVRGARHGPRRAALVAVSVAACGLVLAPWLVRTWIQLDAPVAISTNSGGLLAGANCDEVYSGDFLGQWSFDCLPDNAGKSEAEASAALRDKGLRYARDHADRLPVVIPVRVMRTWELYRPRQQATFEAFFEGRNLFLAQAGVAFYYLLVPLAIYGLVLLRRRGDPLVIMAAPAVVVTLVSIGAYGFTRFRVAADVTLVALAALALVALVEGRRRSPSPTEAS